MTCIDSYVSLADRIGMYAVNAPFIFAVLEYGEFPELLRVAEVLHSRFGRQVLFLFVKRSYRRLKEDSHAVVERGFSWIDSDGELHHTPASSPAASPFQRENEMPFEPVPQRQANKRTTWRRLSALACLPLYAASYAGRDMIAAIRSTASDVANFYRDFYRFRHSYREMEELLRRYQPSLLVVGQEPPGTELPLLLIAAGRLAIPRLLTPFAMFSLRETAEFGWAREDFQVNASALNALTAKIFPHWVLTWKGRSFLRLAGSRALALECAGLVHGQPWSPLSEPVEAITAESEVFAETLVALGINRNRISVTGSPVHDHLALHLQDRDRLRARLCSEHRLDASRPILVCGWPANIFPWLSGRAIRFPDYPALASAWAKGLAAMRDRHGINILISVHPKALPEEYKIAQRHGLACCFGKTDELIAASDLFTTLNGSSVTAWAIACGLPVLLFDCFETNYTDFHNVPGCINVRTESEFLRRLDILCADSGEREKLGTAQRQVAGNWGRLDRGAGKRLGDLAASLLG